jgi:hypothetical protein
MALTANPFMAHVPNTYTFAPCALSDLTADDLSQLEEQLNGREKPETDNEDDPWRTLEDEISTSEGIQVGILTVLLDTGFDIRVVVVNAPDYPLYLYRFGETDQYSRARGYYALDEKISEAIEAHGLQADKDAITAGTLLPETLEYARAFGIAIAANSYKVDSETVFNLWGLSH